MTKGQQYPCNHTVNQSRKLDGVRTRTKEKKSEPTQLHWCWIKKKKKEEAESEAEEQGDKTIYCSRSASLSCSCNCTVKTKHFKKYSIFHGANLILFVCDFNWDICLLEKRLFLMKIKITRFATEFVSKVNFSSLKFVRSTVSTVKRPEKFSPTCCLPALSNHNKETVFQRLYNSQHPYN